MILVTNNEKFLDNVSYLEGKKIVLDFVELDYIEVLERCRDMVHKGYEVLTHPLYGSVKPNETIYRSVLLKEGESLDYRSLSLIEEGIETAKKFKKSKQTPLWIESVKEDFRVIDYDLITKTIDRIEFNL